MYMIQITIGENLQTFKYCQIHVMKLGRKQSKKMHRAKSLYTGVAEVQNTFCQRE